MRADLQAHRPVRTVAAIPAIALIAGAALGIFLPPLDSLHVFVAGSCAVLLVAAACLLRASRWFALIVASAFAIGGMALGDAAWRDASRPPLRIVFEELSRDER